MRPVVWSPPVVPSPAEQAVIKAVRRAKLFVFLRLHRHELFDEQFQAELAQAYADSPKGQPPVPPARLALATIVQAYTGVSDDEVIEATVMDRRWQLVLDCRIAGVSPAHAYGRVSIIIRNLVGDAAKFLINPQAATRARSPNRNVYQSSGHLFIARSRTSGSDQWFGAVKSNTPAPARTRPATARGGRRDEVAALLGEALERYEQAGARAGSGRGCGPSASGPGPRGPRHGPAGGWEGLTATERAVSVLVVGGLTNGAVARRLSISPHTVNTHLRHVFAKLGVPDRAALAAVVHHSIK